MGKKGIWLFGCLAMMAAVAAPAWGADAVRLAYTKLNMEEELIAAAAREQELWKQNGLAADVKGLAGGGEVGRALAARAVEMGMGSSSMALQAASAGVPLLIGSDYKGSSDFRVWVRTASKFTRPQDLKGGKIGVTRFGGVAYAHARAAIKLLGLEGQVRIVATGGIREALAAIRAGTVDARVSAFGQMVELKLKGEVRDIAAMDDYLPKDWTEYVVVLHRQYAQDQAQAVRRTLVAIFQAIDYTKKNPLWARERLRQLQGYSPEAARIVHEGMLKSFTPALGVNRKALENVKNFLREYELLRKDIKLDDVIWQVPPG